MKTHKDTRVLLFDLIATQPNVSGRYHGGGKYAKKIFIELLKRNRNWQVLALYDSNRQLDPEIRTILEGDESGRLVDINEATFSEIIVKEQVARFYTALPISEWEVWDNMIPQCDYVVTVHGLRALETPMDFNVLRYESKLGIKIKLLLKIVFSRLNIAREKIKIRRYISESVKKIAVSNHTKYALLNFFPDILMENVRVYYSPDVTEFELEDDDSIAQIDGSIGTGYYLMVSANRWLKNNLRAVMALDELFNERPYLKKKVVLTGVRNPDVFLRRIKNRGQFVFLDYVSERELRALYQNAYLLLYPSLNEGFGYPVLEAMKYGVPVVASSFTSIPEVCGDAALYVNPLAVHEMKNRILQMNDEDVYGQYATRGKNRYVEIRKRQDADLKAMVEFLLS